MKTIAVTSAILLSAASIEAAEIFKADNLDALNQPSSWVGGVVPGAGDIAQWPLVPTKNMASAIGAPLEFAGIIVTNATGSTTWNSYSITINGSDLLSIGSAGIFYGAGKNKTLAINNPLSVTADQVWLCNGGGTLGVYGSVAFNNPTVIGQGGNTKEVRGGLTGPGTLVNEGGTIKMSNGSAGPNVDFVAKFNAGAQFNEVPAPVGVYRFKSVMLDDTGHYDGAYIQSNGRKNENGHDRVGPLTAAAAYCVMTANPNSATHMTMEVDALSINSAALMHFRGTGLGLSQQADLVPSESSILFGRAPTLLGGAGGRGSVTQSIIHAAIASTNASSSGMSFATYDSAYGIRMLDLETEFTHALPLGLDTLENVRLVNDGTSSERLEVLLPDGQTAVNSLMIDIAGANGTGGFLIGAAEDASPTLRISSGMVYVRNDKSQARTANVDNIPFQGFTIDLAGHCGTFVTYQTDNNNMQAEAVEIHCPIVNDGGEGVTFTAAQNRGFVYLYGTSGSTYTGPTRLAGGLLKLMKDGNVQNICIPGDLEIYSGTCQNTGNTIPDTADIRIYGGSLLQKSGGSNSGSGAQETFRDVTIYGGSYTMGADGTSSGSTTMRSATLFGGSMRQTRGHNLTMTGALTLAGGTFNVNRYEKSSNRTLQSLQGGISITNTVSGAYIPMTFDAGSSETAPGAKSTLSVGITFTGNTTNDNTTVIDAKVPGEGIAFGQFLMNGDLAFDIGDGAADVDLLVRPQLVDNGTTAGSLAKRGSGTLAIANTNAFTGVTSVDAGRLIADGALAGDVTVAAGATFRGGDMGESGALAVGGNITFAQGAKLEFDPGAATTVAGDVVFGGVDIVLKDGAEITEDVLVMKARSFSGAVSGKFGKFVARYRNGGTELWLGKDKGMVISIR